MRKSCCLHGRLCENGGMENADLIDRQELIFELKSYDNGSICRSDSEWETIRKRQSEICELLNIEYPEDAWL